MDIIVNTIKSIVEMMVAHTQFFLGLLVGLLVSSGEAIYLYSVNGSNLKWKKPKES